MSDSRQALFQAVLDRPADDAPRFAYAGYCDAQGDPYGAFIRAQLARTHALRYGSDEDAIQLREEADQLRYKHETPAWTNGVEMLVTHAEFIRGFVDHVIVDARRYLDNADELYRRAPIRQLVLSDVGDLITEIVRDARLAQVVLLSLGNASRKHPLGDAGVAAIAGSPHLRGLKVLDIARQGISMRGLEALCASKTLPSLVYVNLVSNAFEDPRESYANDWASTCVVPESISLPQLGRELEAQYGDLPWLHAPSRLRHCPPLDDEL